MIIKNPGGITSIFLSTLALAGCATQKIEENDSMALVVSATKGRGGYLNEIASINGKRVWPALPSKKIPPGPVSVQLFGVCGQMGQLSCAGGSTYEFNAEAGMRYELAPGDTIYVSNANQKPGAENRKTLQPRENSAQQPFYAAHYDGSSGMPRIVEYRIITTATFLPAGKIASLWFTADDATGSNAKRFLTENWSNVSRAYESNSLLVVTKKDAHLSFLDAMSKWPAKFIVNFMACPGEQLNEQCARVESLAGNVVYASRESEIGNPAKLSIRPSYAIRPIAPQELESAKNELKLYVQKKNEQSVEMARKAIKERQEKEQAIIANYKQAAIGSTIFCEAAYVEKSKPLPLDKAIKCSYGDASINELQMYGWEVSSTTRKSSSTFNDDVSVALKKVRVVK